MTLSKSFFTIYTPTNTGGGPPPPPPHTPGRQARGVLGGSHNAVVTGSGSPESAAEGFLSLKHWGSRRPGGDSTSCVSCSHASASVREASTIARMRHVGCIILNCHHFRTSFAKGRMHHAYHALAVVLELGQVFMISERKTVRSLAEEINRQAERQGKRERESALWMERKFSRTASCT